MSHADSPTPTRGFTVEEYARRTARAQRLMRIRDIDALLLMTEPEVRYFSGFHSQFWESPTRPWYLVVPADRAPIAIIPQIGAAGMQQTWIDDVRTWPAPQPGDEGVSLLSGLLADLARRHARIGIPMGHESALRMPLVDLTCLRERLTHLEFVDASDVIQRLRRIKSEAEIAKIRHACRITSDGFETLADTISPGSTERNACREFKIDLLRRGADGSPYLIGASGHGGYDNIIMGPSDRELRCGDVFIIDTGTVYDGYFCDFDRNFAFGAVSDSARRAHDVVYRATDAAIAAARPGLRCSQLWTVMWKILESGGALGNDVGRLGHGLGMQLTEGPSLMPGDETVLEPGMTITIEPGMCFAPGKLMVHEENVVIRENGADLLTKRAPPEMPVIV